MYICREIFGEKVRVKLTDEEVRKAYYEYLHELHIIDIKQFISNKLELNIDELSQSFGVTDTDYLNMANLYEDEIHKGFTDNYALAKSVIPYLEAKSVTIPNVDDSLYSYMCV